MNQRGEAILFSVATLVVLSGLFLLSFLKLKHSYQLLQKRTHLFLCVKETKGELQKHLVFMGRTNWGIENAEKARVIMLLIPGLQGASASADKVKKVLKKTQDIRLHLYLKTLGELRSRGCPLDLRMLKTPFAHNLITHQRDSRDRALLRETLWTYQFIDLPYAIKLSVHASKYKAISPRIIFHSQEKGGKFSSLSSLR